MMNGINTDYSTMYNYGSTNLTNTNLQNYTNNSIFDTTSNTNQTSGGGGELLRTQLEEVKNEQGIFGKAWNGIKNLFGVGLSSNKIEDKITQYENGEISYEEVQESINKFEQKQKGMTDIIANTTSGLITAGAVIATGGVGLIAGAAIGGGVKAGLKTLDRATNNIDGDAIDIKQMAKDGITGAVDGVMTIATAGMFKGAAIGQSVKEAAKQGAIQGAKAGAMTGAATGAVNYTTDAIFEEDVDFNLKDLAGTTLQNTVAGAAMGGIMGGITGGVSQSKLNKTTSTPEPITPEPKSNPEPTTTTSQQITEPVPKQTAEEIAEDAVEKVKNGENYSQTRENATKNLSHDDKKVVKQELSNVRKEQLKAEKAAIEQQKNTTQNVETKSATAKNAIQGMKNADTDTTIAMAVNADDSAKEAAKATAELKEIAKQNPTHKNKLIAQRAHNQAEQARLNGEKALQQGEQRLQTIESEAAKKAANIEAQKASPNYEAGQAKMAANAEKTSANAAKRAIENTTSKPGYKRAYAKMQNYSKGKLEYVISNSKNNSEIAAAKDLLTALA